MFKDLYALLEKQWGYFHLVLEFTSAIYSDYVSALKVAHADSGLPYAWSMNNKIVHVQLLRYPAALVQCTSSNWLGQDKQIKYQYSLKV